MSHIECRPMSAAPQLTDARVARRAPAGPLAAGTVTAVLEAFARGDVSILALANRHGVSEHTIRNVVVGKTHIHVPGPRLSPERIAELCAKHLTEGRRSGGVAASRRTTCPGCGREWHPIARCPDPRGR